MVKHLSVELAVHGVTGKVIASDNVLTPRLGSGLGSGRREPHPARPSGVGSGGGGAVRLPLLCPGSYITGQAIVIDGGVSRVVR